MSGIGSEDPECQARLILLAFVSWPQESCWSTNHYGSILCKRAVRMFLHNLPNDFCLHLMVLLYLQEMLENIFDLVTLCPLRYKGSVGKKAGRMNVEYTTSIELRRWGTAICLEK